MTQIPCHNLSMWEWTDMQSRLRTCRPNGRKAQEGELIIASARDSLVEGLSITDSRNVTFIPHNLADVFPALTAVEVARCSVKTVYENHFKNLWKLRLLSLSRNQIDYVSSEAFNDLYSLEYLFLAFNKIQTLGATTFDSLRNLKELSLYENRIQCLHPKMFVKLGSVEEIWLSKNKIKILNELIFKKQSKLRHIALNGNSLVEIPEKLFEKNLKLEEIWLHDNQIEFIIANMFDHLPYLEHVALEYNHCADKIYEAATLSVLREDLARHCMEPIQVPEESRKKCQTIPEIEVAEAEDLSGETNGF